MTIWTIRLCLILKVTCFVLYVGMLSVSCLLRDVSFTAREHDLLSKWRPIWVFLWPIFRNQGSRWLIYDFLADMVGRSFFFFIKSGDKYNCLNETLLNKTSLSNQCTCIIKNMYTLNNKYTTGNQTSRKIYFLCTKTYINKINNIINKINE